MAISRVLLNARTGDVLYAEADSVRRNPASLVKMMTLYLIFEALRLGRAHLHDEVTVSERAGRKNLFHNRIGLVEGQVVPFHVLIPAICVFSAYDAAIAAAQHVAGPLVHFVRRMNAEAAEMGLRDTKFRTVTGRVDPRQWSTASDMAHLALRLYTDFPEAHPWLSMETCVSPSGRRLKATNDLLTVYRGMTGIKTGTAGDIHHLAASAQRGDHRLIGVVMGCKGKPQRAEQATALLDMGFAMLEPAGRARPVGGGTIRPERI
jgi:D-alanyl-D-alanine carboxypeptidase